MSQLISRILLTVFMLPLAALVYTTVFVVGDRLIQSGGYHPNRELGRFLGSGVIVWIFIAGYWIALWAHGIRWTAWRVNLTWASAVLAAAAAGAVGIGVQHMAQAPDSFAAFVASAFAPLFWLVATVFIWRETKEERAERMRSVSSDALACPVCGYNLTGLSEARCPECGAKFTLSELFAQQSAREVAATESEMTA